MLRLEFSTKRIFRIFLILGIDEIARFYKLIYRTTLVVHLTREKIKVPNDCHFLAQL